LRVCGEKRVWREKDGRTDGAVQKIQQGDEFSGKFHVFPTTFFKERISQ
jgi:hypothetical protein